MTIKKKTKKKKANLELNIKEIKNGYTVGRYVDDDYDRYETQYCATRAEVFEYIEGLEF